MSGIARLRIDGQTVDLMLDDSALAEVRDAIARREARRRRDLDRAVRDYLREHPAASKNEIAREISRRRAEVLSAVDRVREASKSTSGIGALRRPVPAPRYRPGDGDDS